MSGAVRTTQHPRMHVERAGADLDRAEGQVSAGGMRRKDGQEQGDQRQARAERGDALGQEVRCMRGTYDSAQEAGGHEPATAGRGWTPRSAGTNRKS